VVVELDNNGVRQHILITGGTGFIGTALCRQLAAQGHHVIVFSRDRQRAEQYFSGEFEVIEAMSELTTANTPAVIINLAGRSLGNQRWTEKMKRAYITSRINTTRQLIDYIRDTPVKPQVLLSGSAVGYYGARDDEVLDEAARPGIEYQSALCLEWENEALKAAGFGVRVCLLRMGIVLGPNGGVLSSLVPPFRWGLGAYLGDGRQWLSWIHIDDLIGIMQYLIRHDKFSDAINCTSPIPETNRDFARKLGVVLQRPVFIRVPAWAVQFQAGGIARLYLTGQKVLPLKLLDAGYQFRYPELTEALKDILN
jgi:uncharacterized protein (TIGR01777 family)